MHQEARGRKLSPELCKELSERYKLLSVQEREALREVGEIATSLHSQGATTFPINSQRAEARRGRAEAPSQAQHAEAGMSTSTLEQRLLQGEVTSVPHPCSHDFQRSMHRTLRSMTKHFALTKITREAALREKQEEILRSDLAETLLRDKRRLADVPGARWAGMYHTCPALSCCFAGQQVLPGSWARRHGHTVSHNEGSVALSNAWRTRHKGIRDNPSLWQDPGPVRQACHASQYCHCKGKGLVLRALQMRVQEHLSAQSSDAEFEEKCQNGLLVLRWMFSAPTSAPSAAPSSNASCSSGPVGPTPLTSKWTHLCMMYKKPWRPTLAELDAIQVSDVTSTFCVPEACIRTMWEWLDSLDVNMRIALQIWTLSVSRAPTPILTRYVARPLPNMPLREIWEGLEVERAKARRSVPTTQADAEDLGLSCVSAQH